MSKLIEHSLAPAVYQNNSQLVINKKGNGNNTAVVQPDGSMFSIVQINQTINAIAHGSLCQFGGGDQEGCYFEESRGIYFVHLLC